MAGIGRWMVALCAAIALLSCATESSRRRANPGLPPQAVRTVATPLPRSFYVVRPDVLREQHALTRAGSPRPPGAIIDGLRVAPDGLRIASEHTSPPLLGGSALPIKGGGGYLFWSDRALYFAHDFFGSLQPVAPLASAVQRVRHAPSAIMVWTRGGALAIDPATHQPRPVEPLGLVDIGTLPSGAAAALLDPGRVWTKSATSAWTDVSTTIGSDPTGIRVGRNELWLTRGDGRAYQLDDGGGLMELPALPHYLRGSQPPQAQARPVGWELEVSPWQRVVERGVPESSHHAWVEAKGKMFRIALATGTITSSTPRLLPADRDCRAALGPTQTLLVCRSPSGTSRTTLVAVVRRFGEVAEDRVLEGWRTVFAGSDGTLAIAGPCGSGELTQGLVCIRTPDGRWTDHDLREALTPPAQPSDGYEVLRWIPSATRTVGMVQTSAGLALIDASSGTITKLSVSPAELDLTRSPRRRAILDDRWAITTEGDLAGWTDKSSVVLTRGGELQRAAHVMKTLGQSGALALGMDGHGNVWQSADWGRRWTEVAPPPSAPSHYGAVRCSPVGCVVGSWLRLGWYATVPARRPALGPHAPQPGWSPEPLPKLSCRPTDAEISHGPRLTLAGDGTPLDVGGFGGTTIPLPRQDNRELVRATLTSDEGTMCGMMHATVDVDASDADPAGPWLQRFEVHYRERFEPSVQIQRTHFRHVSLARVAMGAGVDIPEPPGDGAEIVAVPVRDPQGASRGLLMEPDGGSVLLWLRPGRPPLPLALGASRAGWSIHDALAMDQDSLMVLLEDEPCAPEAVIVDGRGARRMLGLPGLGRTQPCADALALDGAGAATVLRLPTFDRPPTTRDLALALRAGQPAKGLAPWSTLTAATTAACQRNPTNGYRVVLPLSADWLDVEIAGRPAPIVGMRAMVRWSADRVCLEALEIEEEAVTVGEGEIVPSLIVRFDSPTPRSIRVGHGEGSSLEQNMACGLSVPRDSHR